MDKNSLIGSAGSLPWHISEDLAWFKQITLGHPVLMGKKTWLSLPFPLPGRQNIVLSSDPNFVASGAIVTHSTEEALSLCGDDEVFVIGGAQIFKEFLALADKLYITRIDAEFQGDTWFPAYNEQLWQLIWTKPCETDYHLRLSFNIYHRNS